MSVTKNHHFLSTRANENIAAERTFALSLLCLLARSLESFCPHFFNRRSTRGQGSPLQRFAGECGSEMSQKHYKSNYKKILLGFTKTIQRHCKTISEECDNEPLNRYYKKLSVCKHLNLNLKMYRKSLRRKMTETSHCEKIAKICRGM